jgi:hypothetical protein
MVGTASGALAREAAQVWNCDPEALVGRGGVVREPDLSETPTDLPVSAKGKAGREVQGDRAGVVPRVSDGSIGNLTDVQIAGQIAVINVTFGGGEGGADTGFTFEVTGVTWTDSASSSRRSG